KRCRVRSRLLRDQSACRPPACDRHDYCCRFRALLINQGGLMGIHSRPHARVACGVAPVFALWISAANGALPAYRVQDLGTLGGSLTQASDLNEAGQVTGYSETADGEVRAFVYSQ